MVAPDTGSPRGDVIALVQEANKLRVGLVAQLLTRLGGFYPQTGAGLADLSAFVQGGATRFWDRRFNGQSTAVKSNRHGSPAASRACPWTSSATRSS